MPRAAKPDNHQEITDRIIAMLEQGVRPWAQQEWRASGGGGRPLRHCGTPYRGSNVLTLWVAARRRSFSSRYWMTWDQALALGAQVRAGAKSEKVLHAGNSLHVEEREDGTADAVRRGHVRWYSVFNADEIDGLAPRFCARSEAKPLDEGERHAAAEAFIANTGATIRHGGGMAFYSPGADEIRLPDFAAFASGAAYYSVSFHELAHWTGAETRLDRPRREAIGDGAHAMEELVAELAAAFLCADMDVASEVREDHASYIADWLKVLKNDKRAVFTAAGQAQKAADFLHDSQPAERPLETAEDDAPEPLFLAPPTAISAALRPAA